MDEHTPPKKQLDLRKFLDTLPKNTGENANKTKSQENIPNNQPLHIKNPGEDAVLNELETIFGRTIPKLDAGSTKRTFGFVEENQHVTELYLTQFSILGLIKVHVLPPSIGELTELQHLEIKLTEIREIPPEIGNLRHLRELNLRANRIHHVCPEIGNLTQLQELDLSHNQLTALPEQIQNLHEILVVDLSENHLTQLPPQLGGWDRVKVVDVHQNDFTEFPEALTQLKNLQHLDLSQNHIQKLPPTGARMENLEILDVHSNQLSQETIQPGVFPKTLRTLYVGQNPVVHQGLEESFPFWIFTGSPKLLANSTEIRYCPAHGKILRPQKRIVHKIKGWLEMEWKCGIPGCTYTEKMDPPKKQLEPILLKGSPTEPRIIDTTQMCPPHEITFVELGHRMVEQCVKCHCTRDEIEQ